MAVIISNLNENIKQMSHKFESFKTHVDKKLSTIEKENYYLRKKVKEIETSKIVSFI